MLRKSATYYFILLLSLFFVIDFFIDNKIRLLGGFYVCNKNISFNLSISPFLFWFIFCALISFLFYLIRGKFYKQEPSIVVVYFFFIGVLLNITDRLLYGCVIDYINVPIFSLPLFNVADILITIGAVFIVFILFSD